MDDEVDGPPPLAPVNEADNQLNDADDAVTDGELLWENTPPNQALKSWNSVMRKLCSGVKSCLCYQKDQVAKIILKKL